MKIKSKKIDTNLDVLRKYKKILREDELKQHDRPVSVQSRTFRDRSKYYRKRKHPGQELDQC